MPGIFPKTRQDGAAIYRITIQGRFDATGANWFDNVLFEVVYDQGASTTSLTGCIEDQAALHGVLLRIHDLGLTLVMVERLDRISGKPPGDGG